MNNTSDMISVLASGASVSGTLVDAIDWDETVAVGTPGDATGFVIAARHGRLVVMASENRADVRVHATVADASDVIRQSLESARMVADLVSTLGQPSVTPVYAGTSVAPEVAPVTVPAGWGSV